MPQMALKLFSTLPKTLITIKIRATAPTVPILAKLMESICSKTVRQRSRRASAAAEASEVEASAAEDSKYMMICKRKKEWTTEKVRSFTF